MNINLPYDFKLRPYQIDPWNAVLDKDFSRGIMVVPRRNGKDILSWNALIAKAMQRRALYYYIAPYYNQVRQIIWEGFDHTGRRFLDYIPSELIQNKTKIDMRIDLVNGSQIKLQGSDAIDRIVGTNPYGIVFTEYSLHKPAAWEYLRPILAENGGWALFNGTPRGFNHFHDLYTAANKEESWFVQYLTRDDTGIPSLEAIEDDRKSGMPEELIQQEYYCSFMSGVVGSYYAGIINELRDRGQIKAIPHEPALPVYTSWDLGINDYNAIWFAQIVGNEVRLIDYYENKDHGLPHYVKSLQDKPYIYEEHFGPHDISVREWSSGKSRADTAADLGLNFTYVKRTSLENGHELVRNFLPRCWFDTVRTDQGVKALLHYQKSFDAKREDYSDSPVKNWARHGADAFKYLAQMLDDGTTSAFMMSNHYRPQHQVNRSFSNSSSRGRTFNPWGNGNVSEVGVEYELS